MSIKVAKKYIASDGTEFETREEAIAHNETTGFDVLVGLTSDDISEVLDGKNRKLGDVLERIAARISRARRAAGILKRNSKPRAAQTQAAS